MPTRYVGAHPLLFSSVIRVPKVTHFGILPSKSSICPWLFLSRNKKKKRIGVIFQSAALEVDWMRLFVFVFPGSTQDQEQVRLWAKYKSIRAAGISWWWLATDAARCSVWTTSRTWRARVRAARTASTLTPTSTSAECPLKLRTCKTFSLWFHLILPRQEI